MSIQVRCIPNCLGIYVEDILRRGGDLMHILIYYNNINRNTFGMVSLSNYWQGQKRVDTIVGGDWQEAQAIDNFRRERKKMLAAGWQEAALDEVSILRRNTAGLLVEQVLPSNSEGSVFSCCETFGLPIVSAVLKTYNQPHTVRCRHKLNENLGFDKGIDYVFKGSYKDSLGYVAYQVENKWGEMGIGHPGDFEFTYNYDELFFDEDY